MNTSSRVNFTLNCPVLFEGSTRQLRGTTRIYKTILKVGQCVTRSVMGFYMLWGTLNEKLLLMLLNCNIIAQCSGLTHCIPGVSKNSKAIIFLFWLTSRWWKAVFALNLLFPFPPRLKNPKHSFYSCEKPQGTLGLVGRWRHFPQAVVLSQIHALTHYQTTYPIQGKRGLNLTKLRCGGHPQQVTMGWIWFKFPVVNLFKRTTRKISYMLSTFIYCLMPTVPLRKSSQNYKVWW